VLLVGPTLCTGRKRVGHPAARSCYPSTEQQIPRAKDALRNDKVVGTKVDEASDKVDGAILVDGFVNIR
jgi:hypothetical protein